MRIGFSKDIHKLVVDRKLMLGGVNVPSPFGEEAHSDGDVVYHALGEAILGALALGDLGKHFPDNIKETENMDSALIIKHIVSLMKEHNYKLGNADVFISLEKPKLKDYIEKMRENIASLCEVNIDRVSVKAGTNEGFGPVGTKEAVEAYAVVLLEENNG